MCVYRHYLYVCIGTVINVYMYVFTLLVCFLDMVYFFNKVFIYTFTCIDIVHVCVYRLFVSCMKFNPMVEILRHSICTIM